MDQNDNDSDNSSMAQSHQSFKEEGNSLYKQKDYRSAISRYTLAIQSATDELDSLLESLDQQDDEEGKKLKKVLASYYGNRAAASTMILKYDDALFDCDQALSLDPKNQKAQVRKGKLYTSLGRLEEAKIAYGRALIVDPMDDKLLKEMDNVKTLICRYDLVQKLLDLDHTDTSSSSNNSNNKIFPYLEMPPLRDAKQALNQIELLLQSTSQTEFKSLQLYKLKALVYTHDIQSAYSLTTSLMRSSSTSNSSPPSSELLLLRAHCLYCMGNIDESIRHLRQILTTGDPDHKSAFSMHKLTKALGKLKEDGDGAYKNRQFHESVEKYTRALDLAPGGGNRHPGARGGGTYRSKLYFNRASAEANLKNHEEVIRDCTSALEIDGGYIKAYTRRAGSYLLVTGEEKEILLAIRDYETARRKAGSNEDLVDELEKLIRKAKVQLKRSKQVDFYKILGVTRDASEAEIKKAYKKSALKWHPDRHANSSEEEKKASEKKFRDINLAYEVLSDNEKKRKYDLGVEVEDLDNPHAGHGGHGGGFGGGGPGGMDPEMLFHMFMQQQGGGGGMRGGGFHFG